MNFPAMVTVLVQKYIDLEDDLGSQKKESKKLSTSKNRTPVRREVNEFVVFTYEGELFPGQIIVVKENGAVVKAMVKTGKAWKWPEIYEDKLFYEWNEVLFFKDLQKVSKTRELYNARIRVSMGLLNCF